MKQSSPTSGEGDEEPGAAFNRRTKSFLRWSLAAFFLVVIAAGTLIKVDYVALVPGSATDTEPMVVVGDDVEEYPSEGEILFTTVRLRQDPNLFEYLWSRFDSDAEVVPEQEILGDLTTEEDRQEKLQLMNDSKEIAIAVALERLGYDTISSDGVVVAQVLDGTSADGVLQPGDVIVSVDGLPVPTALDLIEFLSERTPGETLRFGIQRMAASQTSATEAPEAVETEEVDVKVGAREDDPSVAFLGIGPVDRVTVVEKMPVEVSLDSGAVGGPSAGLAFTLAVLDQLTPGELTGQEVVAVTGTIQFDGRVGPVGGVMQKTAAVADRGVEYFIVPASLGEETLAEMEERAGEDLEIVPVDSVDDALDFLGQLGGDVEVIDEFAAQHS